MRTPGWKATCATTARVRRARRRSRRRSRRCRLSGRTLGLGFRVDVRGVGLGLGLRWGCGHVACAVMLRTSCTSTIHTWCDHIWRRNFLARSTYLLSRERGWPLYLRGVSVEWRVGRMKVRVGLGARDGAADVVPSPVVRDVFEVRHHRGRRGKPPVGDHIPGPESGSESGSGLGSGSGAGSGAGSGSGSDSGSGSGSESGLDPGSSSEFRVLRLGAIGSRVVKPTGCWAPRRHVARRVSRSPAYTLPAPAACSALFRDLSGRVRARRTAYPRPPARRA